MLSRMRDRIDIVPKKGLVMNTASAALAALVLHAVVSGAACAEGLSATPLLDRIDTERDGSISRDEIIAARNRLFERLDLDGDGKLDLGEVDQLREAIMDRAIALQARLGNQWRRLDANGNGTVSAEEFQTRTPLFDLADRDGDGQISAAEFALLRSLFTGRSG